MKVEAYFLDTSVLVSAFLLEKSTASTLLQLAIQRRARMVINEYVVHETRAVLVDKLHVPIARAETFMLEAVVPHLLILKGPAGDEVKRSKLALQDRSDLPILIPCVKHRLTLVSGDERLRKEATRYIRTLSPEQAVRGIQRSETQAQAS